MLTKLNNTLSQPDTSDNHLHIEETIEELNNIKHALDIRSNGLTNKAKKVYKEVFELIYNAASDKDAVESLLKGAVESLNNHTNRNTP